MTSKRPPSKQAPAEGIREKIHEIIFEADTPVIAIVLSVIVICLETVEDYPYGDLLQQVHWGFTILFTVEYFLRVFCVFGLARLLVACQRPSGQDQPLFSDPVTQIVKSLSHL